MTLHTPEVDACPAILVALLRLCPLFRSLVYVCMREGVCERERDRARARARACVCVCVCISKRRLSGHRSYTVTRVSLVSIADWCMSKKDKQPERERMSVHEREREERGKERNT